MQLSMNTCKVCGKSFLAKSKRAEFCPEKSTCRVSWSRKQKKLQKEAEALMIPLEQFVLFEKVTIASPMIGSALNQMLKLYGKEAFTLMLNSMVYVLRVDVS